MTIGLIFPLATFIYGIYFYFYSDFNITKINKYLFSLNIFFFIISVLMIIFNNINVFSNFTIFQVFEFIHYSYAYCLLILALLGIYGCFKYKF